MALTQAVIPAQAGIRGCLTALVSWIPACARMTNRVFLTLSKCHLGQVTLTAVSVCPLFSGRQASKYHHPCCLYLVCSVDNAMNGN